MPSATVVKPTKIHMLSPGSRVIKALLYAVLILLSVICLLPFALMIVNSTRSGADIMRGFSLIPGDALVENWTLVNSEIRLFLGMSNSLFIAVSVTILSGYFSSVTAYAFAVYDFKGRNAIFSFVLLFMMVPAQLGLFGFYDLANSLGLVNTYVPLIVPSIASIGSVFFLRQYTASVLPSALLEAPRIDGAGELLIFHRIAAPVMMPGIAWDRHGFNRHVHRNMEQLPSAADNHQLKR